VHKQITKWRYRKENSGCLVFRKLVLFTLGLGLITWYSMSLLVWKFYQTFAIVCLEFWWWFEPEIPTTRFSINFLFIIARVESKVRLCMKLFDFFPKWILVRLTWNLLRFVPKSVDIFMWNFNNKLFQENFSEILRKPRLYPLQKIVKFCPTFCNFILGTYSLKKYEKILADTFICFLHPFKEAHA